MPAIAAKKFFVRMKWINYIINIAVNFFFVYYVSD